MSIQEAKLELKSKGFLDPAKNPSYKDAVRAKQPTDSEKPDSDVNKNQPQEIVNNNKGASKDEVDITVPVGNRYNVLSQDDDEVPIVEVHMEEETDGTRRKRGRDQNSPPKINENSAAIKKRNLRLNRQTTSENNMTEDISPSPVFQSRFLNIAKASKDVQGNKECECQYCTQEGVTPLTVNHHEQCGCNNCFLKDCKETMPLNKDKLRNIIRNFLSRKDSSGTSSPLESHPEDCMCIKHLHYYRTSKILILDNFLSKQGLNISQNESNFDTDVSKN